AGGLLEGAAVDGADQVDDVAVGAAAEAVEVVIGQVEGQRRGAVAAAPVRRGVEAGGPVALQGEAQRGRHVEDGGGRWGVLLPGRGSIPSSPQGGPRRQAGPP